MKSPPCRQLMLACPLNLPGGSVKAGWSRYLRLGGTFRRLGCLCQFVCVCVMLCSVATGSLHMRDLLCSRFSSVGKGRFRVMGGAHAPGSLKYLRKPNVCLGFVCVFFSVSFFDRPQAQRSTALCRCVHPGTQDAPCHHPRGGLAGTERVHAMPGEMFGQ